MQQSLTILSVILLSLLQQYSHAQKDWKLQIHKDSIHVYTSLQENSPFKAVRTVGNVETSLSKIAHVLMDVSNTEDWVYGAKNSQLIKRFSPTDLIYYSEAALPWPISNRDFIIRITLTQDPITKIMTIVAKNLPKQLPEKKGLVRIQQSAGLWILTPLGKNLVQVDYTLQVDPGGLLPPWLVNLFASNGPYQSLKALRKEVQLPKYTSARLEGIKDL